MSYLYIPFLMQSILMGIDEREHVKRGLGTWERLGHPLDSLTVFVPLAFIAINDFTHSRLIVFIILSVFSCFFITKDEFIHTEECNAFENWLHSLLFILHPMIFICSGLIWRNHPDDQFIHYQPIVVGVFMIYQTFRWSIPWKTMKS